MSLKFDPQFTITPEIADLLMKIEASKQKAELLPVAPVVLASLRKSARLNTTHYSTQIEGNRLNIDEISHVIELKGHFPGRERDAHEVKGYYAALEQLEKYVAQARPLSETMIQSLHAFVMSGGKKNVKPTPYRDGQNVIKDGSTGAIVYLPPEAKDVPQLMRRLVEWIKENKHIPCPIIAAIAHYQFATIHPYYDGNGRTARLLTTLVLHLGGYDLKGLYSLEEYYAKNLFEYYRAISVGPSHNYYFGRADADITGWITYFCQGMAEAFEKVTEHMLVAGKKKTKDYSHILRELDPKQRKVLELLKDFETVTTSQIGDFFGFKPRVASKLCIKWVKDGFLQIVDPSRKARKYAIAHKYAVLLGE